MLTAHRSRIMAAPASAVLRSLWKHQKNKFQRTQPWRRRNYTRQHLCRGCNAHNLPEGNRKSADNTNQGTRYQQVSFAKSHRKIPPAVRGECFNNRSDSSCMESICAFILSRLSCHFPWHSRSAIKNPQLENGGHAVTRSSTAVISAVKPIPAARNAV